jgi:hypothetical protein
MDPMGICFDHYASLFFSLCHEKSPVIAPAGACNKQDHVAAIDLEPLSGRRQAKLENSPIERRSSD